MWGGGGGAGVISVAVISVATQTRLAVYIIHYTLYIIHYTLYIIHYTLYVKQSIKTKYFLSSKGVSYELLDTSTTLVPVKSVMNSSSSSSGAQQTCCVILPPQFTGGTRVGSHIQ